MSTILDALKKSEEQRQSSLDHQGPYLPTTPKRGANPLWLALLIVAVVAGLGLAWLGWQGGQPEPDAAEQLVANSEPAAFDEGVASTATDSGSQANVDEPGLVAQTSPAAGGTENMSTNQPAPAQPVDDQTEIEPPPVIHRKPTPQVAEAPRRPPERYSPPTTEPTQADQTNPAQAGPTNPARPVQTDDQNGRPTAQPTRTSQPARPTSPADQQLPIYPSIERSLREELGPLRLDMFLFSAERERRFALINMQRVGEGDELTGATVEQIRKDGVVLRAGGQRFLLAPKN